MLKCKLKVLFIARSSDMQNLGKNQNLTAFQTRSPTDERDAAPINLMQKHRKVVLNKNTWTNAKNMNDLSIFLSHAV